MTDNAEERPKRSQRATLLQLAAVWNITPDALSDDLRDGWRDFSPDAHIPLERLSGGRTAEDEQHLLNCEYCAELAEAVDPDAGVTAFLERISRGDVDAVGVSTSGPSPVSPATSQKQMFLLTSVALVIGFAAGGTVFGHTLVSQETMTRHPIVVRMADVATVPCLGMPQVKDARAQSEILNSAAVVVEKFGGDMSTFGQLQVASAGLQVCAAGKPDKALAMVSAAFVPEAAEWLMHRANLREVSGQNR